MPPEWCLDGLLGELSLGQAGQCLRKGLNIACSRTPVQFSPLVLAADVEGFFLGNFFELRSLLDLGNDVLRFRLATDQNVVGLVFLVPHLAFYRFIFLAQLFVADRMILDEIDLIGSDEGRLARYVNLGGKIRILVELFFMRLLGNDFLGDEVLTQGFPRFRSILLTLAGARLHDEVEARLGNCHTVHLGHGGAGLSLHGRNGHQPGNTQYHELKRFQEMHEAFLLVGQIEFFGSIRFYT